jgi:L-lactate utilization protein LutB
MSKKKKHPVRKMTETDYANYIMSLKDERPTKTLVPENYEKDEK